MKYSSTPYDDVFRTLLNDCRRLIIFIINEIFGESYTGDEEVVFGANKHFLNQQDGDEEKRVTDSSFEIVGKTRKKYHAECQATADGSMLIRFFEYDSQIALDTGTIEGSVLTVAFPHSAAIFLRHKPDTPDRLTIRIMTPGGEVSYQIPVMKVQQYSLEEIFAKKLLFLLPFHIFAHENNFAEYEADEAKLEELREEYSGIAKRLEELEQSQEIDAYTKCALCDMSKKVLGHIAQDYNKVRKGVDEVMGGKILEYEAKMIRNEALNEGLNKGLNEGLRRAQAETEERAKDMIRDKMDLSMVEKYTRLPMPHIQKLAHGLGML